MSKSKPERSSAFDLASLRNATKREKERKMIDISLLNQGGAHVTAVEDILTKIDHGIVRDYFYDR